MTDAFAGFIGGILSIYVGLPLDTVKVRLQTKGHLFTSAINCAYHTVRVEGIKALWKGAIPAVTTGVIENAVVFSANGILHRVFCTPHEETGFLKLCALNGGSAVFSGFCITPSEVIKCRLQTNIGYGESSHVLHVMRDLYRTDGLLGYFRGLSGTWARDIPFYMVFFGCYTYYKNHIINNYYLERTDVTNTDQLPGWHFILGGGLAGSAAWFSIFPCDVIKSRQQTASKKVGFFDTGINLYRERGIRNLYKGCWPCVLRGFPANGVLFLVVEYTKILFDHLGLDSGRSLGSGSTHSHGEED